MTRNVRFAEAVHILVMLALEDGPKTSGIIAQSVSTNPVVIRRILLLLERAGLVTGRMGTGGGFRLARAARGITLAEVFRAVDADGAAPPAHRPNPRCPVGSRVGVLLNDIGRQVEGAFLGALAARTLAAVTREVREGRPRDPKRRMQRVNLEA